MIFPEIVEGPLGVRSTRIEDVNTYETGTLLSFGPAGWLKATNGNHLLPAVAMVVAAQDSVFRIVTSRGQVVPWPDHGQGVAGDSLFLGVNGSMTTTRPGGPAVSVQRVALVLDGNNLLLFPPDIEQPREVTRLGLAADQPLGMVSGGIETAVVWTLSEEDTAAMNPTPSATITAPVSGFYMVAFSYKLVDPSPSGSRTHIGAIVFNGGALHRVQEVEHAGGVLVYGGSVTVSDSIVCTVLAGATTSDPEVLDADYTKLVVYRAQ